MPQVGATLGPAYLWKLQIECARTICGSFEKLGFSVGRPCNWILIKLGDADVQKLPYEVVATLADHPGA